MTDPTRETAAASEDGQRTPQQAADETPILMLVRVVTQDEQGRVTSHRGMRVPTVEEVRSALDAMAQQAQADGAY